MLCVHLNTRGGGEKFEIADFSPYTDKPPEQEATIEEAFGLLGAIAKSAAPK